jgi:hypothetical protein
MTDRVRIIKHVADLPVRPVKSRIQAWNAGRANQPVVSHTVPTDDGVRREVDWN